MALGIIEIFALIVAILATIKLLIILINPKSWLGVVKKVYTFPILTQLISLILAAIVLYYLLQSVTIVQIFAVMLFLALLGAITISSYPKQMINFANRLLKKGVSKAWLSILIWFLLIIWVLYTIFS